MATDVKSVLDSLGKMTVLELVELKNAIEEEWGVTAAAPVAIMASASRNRMTAIDTPGETPSGARP